MILETVISGLVGGIMRFAPEVLKFFDSKNSREHELKMLSAEMEFAKLGAEREMHRVDADLQIHELDAVSAAIKEQGQTARAAGKFVAALSALVRPLVTYWFVGVYSAVKTVSMIMAVQAGADWKEVLVQNWTIADMNMLVMILTFWFVGRVYERR